MKASFAVLKKDKELLVFAFLSSICCIILMASFLVPIILTENYAPPARDAATETQVAYYGTIFLFYFCNYFVIVFFNSAIISCAIIRLQGGDPTLADGFNAALSRLHFIAGWALLSATIGLILRILEDRNKKAGAVIAGVLGMAWTVMTFLAVPVLVSEKLGPIAALKRSSALLRETWGNQLVGNFGFGVLYCVSVIPGVLLIMAGMTMGKVLLYISLVVGILYFVLVGLIQSTLQAIFQAAVYLYASDRLTEGDFSKDLLGSAMRIR